MGKKDKLTAKQQLRKQQIDQVNDLGSNIDEYLLENQLSTIEQICGEFIKRVVKNIDAQKLPVTGKISDINIETQDNEVRIMMYPHLIYIDRGVSGTEKKYNTPHSYTDKKPPVGVFINWIKDKNIQARNNDKYDQPESPFKSIQDDDRAAKGLAFAIQNKIFKDGISPRNVYSKEIPKLIDDLIEEVGNITVSSVINVTDVKPTSKRQTI